MIKVPATPAGLDALEELVAAGVTVNVTLVFSSRQYQIARDAVWRGAQRRKTLDGFKSVYSIFVSRLDVYTEKAVPQLSPAAQGMVGILNAKRIWAENRQFWAAHPTPLAQEMVFASTGTKKPSDPPWKYVEAFAGSDIETNPPATNEAVAQSGAPSRAKWIDCRRRKLSRRSTGWSTCKSSKRRSWPKASRSSPTRRKRSWNGWRRSGRCWFNGHEADRYFRS